MQDQKMEGLVVQLDNYSRLGIPKLHHLAVFPDPAEDLVEEGNPRRDINSENSILTLQLCTVLRIIGLISWTKLGVSVRDSEVNKLLCGS